MEALGRASRRYSDVSWRKGRRRDVLLVLATAAIAGLVTAVGAMWGDTERIGAYWTSAELDERDQAQIVEVIDYDFGSWPRKKHGILRDIPGVERSAEIIASSPTAPDSLRVTFMSGEARLRIGDPFTEISDRHRYRIEYSLGTLVEGDRFSWNAVGTRWLVPIDEVEAHVLTPYELVDVTCDRGRRSAVGGCTAEQIEPGHLVVYTSGLGDAEGVTVSATLGAKLQTPPSTPPPPTGPPDDPGLGVVLPAIVAVSLALLGGAVVWRVIRRIGRERVWAGGAVAAAFGPGRDEVVGVELLDHRQLAEMATIEFEPPEELSAAAGGVVYDEHVRPQHKVAWLIECAIRDEIVLDVNRSLPRIERGDAEPNAAVGGTLDTMFGRRSSVVLGTYDSRFASSWNGLTSKLERWRAESGLWDPHGPRRRKTAQVLGISGLVLGLAALLGGGALANRGWVGGLLLVAVGAVGAGGGATAWLRAWELPVRTPEGSALWLRIESFRRFIADSEARHAEAAAQMGVLRQYTAWAVALGELDHWEAAVREASAIPNSAAAGARADVLFVGHTGGLSRSTAQATVAPRPTGSSGGGWGGGGGGGGGGAGGGGGGGGGGSW